MINARQSEGTMHEQFLTGLERWLKTRRDEHDPNEGGAWYVLDCLLEETRDALCTGETPWDRMDRDG